MNTTPNPLFDEDSSEYGRDETGSWEYPDRNANRGTGDCQHPTCSGPTCTLDAEAVPDDMWRDPRPGERLYTFGLVYDGDYIEEIDLYARNDAQARRRVRALAEEGYDPSYSQIIAMDPGGSAGLV